MKAIILFLAAAGLAAGQQDATVGLSAAPVYNDNATDKQGPAVVLYVMDGTPAAKAGIQGGDLIVGVNGSDVNGKESFQALHDALLGGTGGNVKLTLWRESEGRQYDAELTRVPYPLRRNPASDPFAFSSPANWRPEVDAFPLPWSPQLAYRGWEDLVFAPNFDDRGSPNFHAYAFVLWLEGKQEFSAARLEADLLTYYKGISEERGRTRKFTPDLSRVSVAWSEQSGAAPGAHAFRGDATFYAPTGDLLTLHGEATIEFCAGADHTAGVFVLSPREHDTPIWKDLEAIRDSFRCSKP